MPLALAGCYDNQFYTGSVNKSLTEFLVSWPAAGLGQAGTFAAATGTTIAPARFAAFRPLDVLPRAALP